jgi:hypothetical protein
MSTHTANSNSDSNANSNGNDGDLIISEDKQPGDQATTNVAASASLSATTTATTATTTTTATTATTTTSSDPQQQQLQQQQKKQQPLSPSIPTPPPPPPDPIISITNRLLSLRGSPPGTLASISESEIKQICTRVKPIILSQPMLLELEAPLKICGDVHGQYTDLLRLFEYGGFPPNSNYLFLGDYVDRGKQSLEVICLLLCYKIQYPTNFFLLRGNHEAAGINRIYGFYDECKRRYSIKLWKVFSDVFNCLPVSALVDEKILCMHGGLSPEISSLQQIADLSRPSDVPDVGLMCDLLWSDPDTSVSVSTK